MLCLIRDAATDDSQAHLQFAGDGWHIYNRAFWIQTTSRRQSVMHLEERTGEHATLVL